MGRGFRIVAAGASLVLLAGCARAAASHDDNPVVGPISATTTSSTTTTSTTTTTLPPTTTTLPPTTAATAATAAAPPPATHHPVDPNGAPFAQVGGVTLLAPSHAVERVGFHQSADSGAQELTALPGAVLPVDMNTRNRGTGAQTAADTVVQPGTTVYSPVSGTVVKSGAYQLYCRYADDMVEVDPDGHPGWRVTILHLEGVVVTPGMHLVAGITPIAGQAHQLPFSSQVDKYSPAKPAWPHVHVEVDDPSIPDTPSKGDSCGL